MSANAVKQIPKTNQNGVKNQPLIYFFNAIFDLYPFILSQVSHYILLVHQL